MSAQPSAEGAIALLEEIRELMVLKGENPFKIRAFEKAQGSLAGVNDLMARAKNDTLTEIPGIGKGISEVLKEYFLKGTSSTRDELRESLPEGLIELTQIPGLGPKRALALIEALEIRSVSELEYACRENRLLKIKGFGQKAQQKIIDSIAFLKSTSGQLRIDDAEVAAEALLKELIKAAGKSKVSDAGALRRRMETLSELDFLIESPSSASDLKATQSRVEKALAAYRDKNPQELPVRVHYAKASRWGYELARLTASEAHWEALGKPAPLDCETEEEFYASQKCSLIPPESRESGEEVALARAGKMGELIPWDGVRGVFHNHTTRSDGTATLEEMVIAAKGLGYQYIGISDHSQAAFYAQGLKKDDLAEQEKEVRKVQDKHPEIRIFWGIESDILADGSLDYDDKQLKRFDFVIASIHSRFQMEREAMTDRVLEAIRHPATRFLGHATGRLLLGRKGYDIDMERVITEAAKRDVAIEINANPARLDIDWRWGKALRSHKTQVSINPDAHEISGLENTRFGIAVARKALIPTSLVVNARSVKDVEQWLKRA